ncbi:polymorphic toxin type 15 domain-containing protein [Shewanella sp. CG12_big_fil_rev_8_21_14_0_65_47_15]|uniref:polymorphic toxin type 15 domain-containing protein n=1 Tax=Shewanella sp. CG12_big_fil_rev_8_21_14_0_65_47_15 TaxID=1975537 RepID=UPI0025DDAD22|nr:polymorphic toxin type 15 domain-containing protein [Shewanella sp. CG12_big_fil_rev_8_21_14_0_65_47_15]
MQAKSLSLKARSGDLILFSTTKPTRTSLAFSDEQSAIAFLQSMFSVSDLPGDTIVSVYAWFNQSASFTTTWSQARAGALRQTLAKALVEQQLFAAILPAKPVEVPSAPASSSSAPTAKASNPGGRAEPTQSPSEHGQNDQQGQNAAGQTEPPNKDKVTCGDPVAMCSGEEILALTDFSLEGAMPLIWTRTYRSSQSAQNQGLGFGWRSNFHQHIDLIIDDEANSQFWFVDEEGRRLPFAFVPRGKITYQLAEGLALRHESNGSLVLVKSDDTHWVFVPCNEKPQCWVLHQVINQLGHTLQLFYDRYQRLSRIDYTAKRGIELTYHANGNISRIEAVRHTDQGLQRLGILLAIYEYDEANDLRTATNRTQQTEQYQYNGHLLVERERASGFKHYFTWYGAGPLARCRRNWGDDGCYDYHFEYHEAERLAVSTDSRGQVWHYYHDAQNRLIKKIAPDGATWQYQWNAQGKKTAEIQPSGAVTTFEYNRRGQLSRVIAADEGITQFQYNALGQRSGVIDAEGQEWRREFSSAGLLRAETGPNGASVRYEYNNLSQLVSITDACGQQTKLAWDKEGQLLAQQSPQGLTRYSYDELGLVNGIVDAAGLVTEWQRNSAGQVICQRQYPFMANGQIPEHDVIELHYQYDDAGRLICQRNSLGHEQRLGYAGLSQASHYWQADGSHFAYQYDSERNLTAIQRSDDACYQIDYDGQERPIQIQGFDGRSQQIEYDVNGRIHKIQEGKQGHVILERDTLGRIIQQKAHKETSTGRNVSEQHFHYDKLGRLLRANNAQRKLRFGYASSHFGNNKALKSHWQDNWHIEHEYDNFGRKIATLLPDGSQITLRYNEQGHAAYVGFNQQPLLQRQFDSASRETEREYHSGILLSQQYDVFGRLCAQQWQGLTSAQEDSNSRLHERSYHYSLQHQCISVSDTFCGQWQYQYDSLDQLVSKLHLQDPRQNEQHQWDSFGNPQGESIAVQGDRLLQYDGRQFRYDDSGNQVSVSAAKASVNAASTPVSANRMAQKREFNGLNQLSWLESSSACFQYEYDALGRRSAKITAQGRIDYLWDGDVLIGEHYLDHFTWYLYEPNSHKPMAMVKDGQVYHYQLDQLGTPIGLINATNQLVWQAHYSVFGKATVTINDINNPLRFQGQYFDSESGLHYNHFRYYDPETGRFISQDPIGLLGGINHYRYAPNHINWIDPLGLSCKEGLGEVAYGPPPEEPGLQSVTLLPIEWAVEGIADSIEQLSTMLETGPTLVGAATMAVALIPGKVADKVLEPVVKKLDNVEVPSNKALTVAKASLMKKHKVACFKKNSKGSDIEYDRQLKGQQDGINKMSVKEYLDNRESYNAIGRKGTGAAQDKARKDFKEKLIKEYTDKLVNEGEYLGQEALDKAQELALSDMKTLNALHNPDMIAGGKDIVFDLGDASVNQSIGSQWKNKGVNELGEKMLLTRVELMDIEAQKALDEFGPDTLMDVDLHRCK